MATCDLAELYGDLATRLPISEDDDSFLFTRETLPSPPPSLTSDRLVLRKGTRTWNGCFRCDTLDLFARPGTLRQFGALALAVLFHPEPSTVELVLTHPESSVKRFRIRFEHMTMEPMTGYWATPTALEYWASDPSPLIGIDPPRDRPGLWLTDEDELGPDDWDSRDTVIGFGGQEATVAMASLFLDAEPVKTFETSSQSFFCASFSIVGLLIHATVGSLGGEGRRWRNRPGLAA